jgi:pyridoxine 5-phosphate synthase
MEARLHLALDTVATFRSMRQTRDPDPVVVASLAELSGVQGLFLLMREDRRQAQERDLRLLRETCAATLDLGLAPTGDLVGIAFDLRPDRVTLVPDSREAHGHHGGLDVQLLKEALRKHVQHLHDAEIEVAVRIEPDLEQVKALHRVDADVAVLNTEPFSRAQTRRDRAHELTRLADAAATAARLKVRIAVGGGLDLGTTEEIARIPHVGEFHLGHACIARSVLLGIERAVGDFRAAVERGRNRLL